MAKSNTMKDVPIENVLNVLNSTPTKTSAAQQLDTTRQTLNNYIKSKRIKRECKYVAPLDVIEISAQPTTGE